MLDEDSDLALGRMKHRRRDGTLDGGPPHGSTSHSAEVVSEQSDLIVVRPGLELVRSRDVPRHVPAPHEFQPWADDNEIALLAHNLSGMARAPMRGAAVECSVPAPVFHSSKRQIAIFIKHLWVLDGAVRRHSSGRGGRIYLTSQSRHLLDEVSRLLLRFGISCRIREERI